MFGTGFDLALRPNGGHNNRYFRMAREHPDYRHLVPSLANVSP
jgi:hypothetical protein